MFVEGHINSHGAGYSSAVKEDNGISALLPMQRSELLDVYLIDGDGTVRAGYEAVLSASIENVSPVVGLSSIV